MQCGLLGAKLSHSYSPKIHKLLGSYTYSLFEKDPDELQDFLKNGDFTGLNVTIPYKQTVIPFCDSLSSIAQRLGAVNVLVRQPDGTLMGHNTDYFGFETMLNQSGLNVKGKKTLVLGTGGASKVAAAVLEERGACVVVISRNGEHNYATLNQHTDAAVIVNTTPVGMFPHTGNAPISLDQFSCLEGVLDVIYNPSRTKLLLDAEKRGVVAMNGLLMLVAQAKEASEWFTGTKIPDEKIHKIHAHLKNQMENIVLVGMPGTGKSTVGQILAEHTGKRFVDVDSLIAEKAGCAISQIFAEQGEARFRKLETQVLEEVGKQSGLVIATGGGCVTKEDNYPLLHQNGRIFCLERELSLLPTEGRPLSQKTALNEMYQIRKPMYARFADYHVTNNGKPDDAAQQILRIWEECQ